MNKSYRQGVAKIVSRLWIGDVVVKTKCVNKK